MDINLIDTLRQQLSMVQAQLKEQQQLTALMTTERNESKSPGGDRGTGYRAHIAEVISEQKRGIILDRLSGIQRVLQVSSSLFLISS